MAGPDRQLEARHGAGELHQPLQPAEERAAADAECTGDLLVGGSPARSASIRRSAPVSGDPDGRTRSTGAELSGTVVAATNAMRSSDGLTGLGTPNGTTAFTAAGGGGTTVTVTNPGAQTGTVGTSVTLQLSASGGTAPYTYTATGLPAGLSISSSGLISGAPTTAGTYSVTVSATDSAGHSGSKSFTWTIGSGSCSGQKFANPGFESGNTAWSASPA